MEISRKDILIADVVFDASFRSFCEENLCGNYDANWSCPPACGSFETLRECVLRFRRGIVLRGETVLSDRQTLIADELALNRHAMELAASLSSEWLLCGAGNCNLCDPCEKLHARPCRHPKEQYICLSAYCVDVSRLAEHCGMTYHTLPGKTALFCLIAYDAKEEGAGCCN